MCGPYPFAPGAAGSTHRTRPPGRGLASRGPEAERAADDFRQGLIHVLGGRGPTLSRVGGPAGCRQNFWPKISGPKVGDNMFSFKHNSL